MSRSSPRSPRRKWLAGQNADSTLNLPGASGQQLSSDRDVEMKHRLGLLADFSRWVSHAEKVANAASNQHHHHAAATQGLGVGLVAGSNLTSSPNQQSQNLPKLDFRKVELFCGHLDWLCSPECGIVTGPTMRGMTEEDLVNHGKYTKILTSTKQKNLSTSPPWYAGVNQIQQMDGNYSSTNNSTYQKFGNTGQTIIQDRAYRRSFLTHPDRPLELFFEPSIVGAAGKSSATIGNNESISPMHNSMLASDIKSPRGGRTSAATSGMIPSSKDMIDGFATRLYAPAMVALLLTSKKSDWRFRLQGEVTMHCNCLDHEIDPGQRRGVGPEGSDVLSSAIICDPRGKLNNIKSGSLAGAAGVGGISPPGQGGSGSTSQHKSDNTSGSSSTVKSSVAWRESQGVAAFNSCARTPRGRDIGEMRGMPHFHEQSINNKKAEARSVARLNAALHANQKNSEQNDTYNNSDSNKKVMGAMPSINLKNSMNSDNRGNDPKDTWQFNNSSPQSPANGNIGMGSSPNRREASSSSASSAENLIDLRGKQQGYSPPSNSITNQVQQTQGGIGTGPFYTGIRITNELQFPQSYSLTNNVSPLSGNTGTGGSLAGSLGSGGAQHGRIANGTQIASGNQTGTGNGPGPKSPKRLQFVTESSPNSNTKSSDKHGNNLPGTGSPNRGIINLNATTELNEVTPAKVTSTTMDNRSHRRAIEHRQNLILNNSVPNVCKYPLFTIGQDKISIDPSIALFFTGESPSLRKKLTDLQRREEAGEAALANLPMGTGNDDGHTDGMDDFEAFDLSKSALPFPSRANQKEMLYMDQKAVRPEFSQPEDILITELFSY